MNLLTLQEAMDLLEVSRSTLDRWRKTKCLPFIKIGKEIYFHREDLQQWIRNQTTIHQPHEAESRAGFTGPETITIGYQSGTAYMWSPIIIKELRLLEDELAVLDPSHPISVRWQDAVSGLELVEGMIGGHIQIASLGDYPMVVSHQLSQLLPHFKPVLLAFDGKSSQGKGISIVVPRGSAVQDPSDLAGENILTVTNSSAGCRVNRLLTSIGGQSAQVVHNNMNRIMAEIIRKNTKVSVMWEPYPSLVKFKGVGEILCEDGLGEDYLTGVVAQDGWSQRNEAIVIAYLKAHLRAHQIVRDYPIKAAKIISNATGFPQQITADVIARVRWDSAVYRRDMETLINLGDRSAAPGISCSGKDFKTIAYRGYYLETASKQLMLPRLTGSPLVGDWSYDQVY